MFITLESLGSSLLANIWPNVSLVFPPSCLNLHSFLSLSLVNLRWSLPSPPLLLVLVGTLLLLSLSSLLFCWCSSRVNPENSGQIHAILSTFFSGFFLVMYVVESTIPRSDIKVQQPPLPSLSRKSCLNKTRLLTLRFDQKKQPSFLNSIVGCILDSSRCNGRINYFYNDLHMFTLVEPTPFPPPPLPPPPPPPVSSVCLPHVGNRSLLIQCPK